MNVKEQVAKDKQRHPERFCPAPGCLWKTAKLDHATQTYSWPNGRWCPRHKQLEAQYETGAVRGFTAEFKSDNERSIGED